MSALRKLINPSLIVQLIIVIVIFPFLPLLISARWSWWAGWAYALISILGFIGSRWLAARRHPQILAERARSFKHENTKPWDKVLAPVMAFGGLLSVLVAGLDARFGWTPPFNLALNLVGLGLILGGYVLGSYALIANRFFSGVVRIQEERGHHVVSSGPYRWVRHPGYAGAIITYLATPLLLNSTWTFLPAILVTLFSILRTGLEDRVLQNELSGYRAYAGRVRYRLLPGIW